MFWFGSYKQILMDALPSWDVKFLKQLLIPIVIGSWPKSSQTCAPQSSHFVGTVAVMPRKSSEQIALLKDRARAR